MGPDNPPVSYPVSAQISLLLEASCAFQNLEARSSLELESELLKEGFCGGIM